MFCASGCYIQDPASPSGDTDTDGDTDAIVGGSDGAMPPAETSGSSSDGEGDSDTPIDPASCEEDLEWTRSFLVEQCGTCHGGGASEGGFDFVDDYDQLLSSGKLVPGDPEASAVWVRIDNGTMPPAGVEPRPSVEQSDRLRGFLLECEDPGQGLDCDNDELTALDVLRSIQDDLTFVDADDRLFTRYLTLSHLYNAGLCDDDLRVYRDAMAKLINALSSEVLLRAPVAVDASGTIFRIDLRDYGWDNAIDGFDDKWEALVAASPYAFQRLEDEAETIQALSGTRLPVLAGDAFIDIASQPPLYHDLVGIPDTLQQLEQQLALNIEANIDAGEVARAGVLDSGVSAQNRIIERHDIPLAANRAFWVSYDFADDSQEEQNIFASPLDFEEAGGEVIFSLPNGLHAYMLTDAAGNRLDVAPDAIVTDPSQEDDNVRNGISCFGCHPVLIPAVDSVRDYVLSGVEFDAQTKDVVEEIYPTADDFTDIVNADTLVLHAAVSSLDIDPGLTLEPVSDAFARFQFNVTLEVAAAELGISPDALATQLGGLEPALAPLAGGAIKRDTWSSLFANTVCALNLGVANDPACDDAR